MRKGPAFALGASHSGVCVCVCRVCVLLTCLGTKFVLAHGGIVREPVVPAQVLKKGSLSQWVGARFDRFLDVPVGGVHFER